MTPYDTGDIAWTIFFTMLYFLLGKGTMTIAYYRKRYFEDGFFPLTLFIWPITLVYYSFRSGEDL